MKNVCRNLARFGKTLGSSAERRARISAGDGGCLRARLFDLGATRAEPPMPWRNLNKARQPRMRDAGSGDGYTFTWPRKRARKERRSQSCYNKVVSCKLVRLPSCHSPQL